MSAPAERPDNALAVSAMSADDQADFHATNAALDRMRAINPPDPYILTIPQDVEPRYHHWSQAYATQWLTNSPFQRKEGEMSQYQTFVYHEHGKDMYVLHNSLLKEQPEKSRTGTGASTPNTAPKKKMTLGAYKKKQMGGDTPAEEAPAMKAVEAPAKQVAVKGPVERLKAETEQVLAAVSEEKDLDVSEPKAAPERNELKRKRAEDVGEPKVQPVHTTQKASAGTEQPATKKSRMTSPPPVKEAREATRPAPTEEEKPRDAPAAPVAGSEPGGMPPKLSPLHMPSLPSRLSPTVPENIAATLRAREEERISLPESSAAALAPKSALLTPAKKVDGVTKHKSPVPRNGFRANSSSPAVRSDAEDRAPPPTSSGPAKAASPKLSRQEEVAVGKALNGKSLGKRSLIVKLRYKKHQREAVRRILKIRPRPDRIASPTVASAKPEEDAKLEKPVLKKRDPTAKGVAQKVGPAPKPAKAVANGVPKKVEDQLGTTEQLEPQPKQPATDVEQAKQKKPVKPADHDTDEPAVKRKKVPGATESKQQPSTPAQPSDLSTAPSSAQRPQQVTPSIRKDHLTSAAMKRERSADSHQAETPSAKPSDTPRPNGVTTQPSGPAKSSAAQPSGKTPKQQAWEAEQTRLEVLGRELKHAATAHLKSRNLSHAHPTNPSNEQKLAAIKSVESLLAYIFAFTCADEAASAADPKQVPSTRNWRSLQDYLGFVKHNCKPFPALTGLACHLGVVFNVRILEISTQSPSGPKEHLLDTCTALSKAAGEAEAKLDLEALQENFPRSWTGRSKGALSGDDLRDPGAFAGPYKLPLGVHATPLRSGRAGHAMVSEWLSRQDGVSYELQLKL